MATAIIEAIVEEIVVEIVEESVVEVVENAVEDAVEQAVEESVEESVEQAVEDAVEDAIEEAVDEAVEDEVEEGVENAVGSTIKKKILKLIGGLIAAVGVISPLIDLIKAGTEAGKKKCDIDDETKNKISRSEGILDVLNALLKSWTDDLKTYNEHDNLGNVTYKSTTADAAGVVWSLLNDMKEELRKALRITDECQDNCKWKANIDQFELYVIQAAYNVNAIFLTKDNAPVMKEKNFPPETDRQKMTDAFNKFYGDKDWQMIIKMNAKKNLTKAVQEGAKKASEAAVKTLIKKPLKTGIKSGIEKDVVPDVKNKAKSAAKAETTVVFNEWNARINEHAAIPVYGIATLKSWMMENIKPEAVRKATEKATAAANAVMQLPDAQITIMHITSDTKDQVLRQYKDQIKKTADQAADDYIKKVLAAHKSK